MAIWQQAVNVVVCTIKSRVEYMIMMTKDSLRIGCYSNRVQYQNTKNYAKMLLEVQYFRFLKILYLLMTKKYRHDNWVSLVFFSKKIGTDSTCVHYVFAFKTSWKLQLYINLNFTLLCYHVIVYVLPVSACIPIGLMAS